LAIIRHFMPIAIASLSCSMPPCPLRFTPPCRRHYFDIFIAATLLLIRHAAAMPLFAFS